MKRDKLTDRHQFDIEDKVELLKKTGGKCTHCGAKLKIGKNMTLDHYIPLSKGGINQRLNIVPLCQKCNKEKTNKIIGTWWLEHLNKKDLKELEDYFDSYLSSFDYVTRGNLYPCDMYRLSVYIGPKLVTKNSAKRKKIMETWSKKFILERVRKSQVAEAQAFYIEYLKKYDLMHSEDRAKKDVEFWSQFSAMYALRDKEGNMEVLIPISMAEDIEGLNYLMVMVFSKRYDPVTGVLISNIQRFLAETLMKEQNLPYIRSQVLIPIEDNARKYIDGFENGGFMTEPIFISKEGVTEHDDSKVDFYKKFYNVEKYMREFFSKKGYDFMERWGEMMYPTKFKGRFDDF